MIRCGGRERGGYIMRSGPNIACMGKTYRGAKVEGFGRTFDQDWRRKRVLANKPPGRGVKRAQNTRWDSGSGREIEQVVQCGVVLGSREGGDKALGRSMREL